MDRKLLVENLTTSPIIPMHYTPQFVTAIGGRLEMGDPTSKQGGTNILGHYWETGEFATKEDFWQTQSLISFCRRNELFYVITPSKNEKQIMVFITDNYCNSARVVGRTIEGTFAAALVLLMAKANAK